MSITNWEDDNIKNYISSNYDLYAGTGQITNMKTIFEVIKDIVLEDINIKFEKDYITIIKENSNKKSMIHLKLDTTFFEKYEIGRDSITIGVNSVDFYKIIKTAKKGETISFCCKKSSDLTQLIVRIENSVKNTIAEDTLNILKFEEEVSCMPAEVEYSGSIITPSKDFQRIFKNIKSKSTKRSNKIVEIIHTGQQLIFKYTGEFSEQKVVLGAKQLNTLGDVVENEIIQGLYDLDYLLIFAKATNLNSNMMIRIQNDLPLILEYKVGSMGTLHLLLNPIESEI
jgi:proliferating cell nuclear antigen